MFLFPCVSLRFVTMATAARSELFLVHVVLTVSDQSYSAVHVVIPAITPSSAHLQTSLPLENVDERMTSGAIQA